VRRALKPVLIGLAVIVGALVVALAPFFLLTPRAPKTPASLQTVAGLDAYLQSLTANETPPALDLVVMKDGAIAYSKAFGVADGIRRTPATTDGIYRYWSVTKLFTATAVMQLAEDGKLALDDQVTKYLPGFQTVDPSGSPAAITVRQLLNHTSGMKNLGPFDLLGWIHRAGDPPVGQAALVRDRMDRYRKLAATPGAVSSYSNAGYIVLGAVVEAASGEPYEDYVRTRILAPLGMTASDFVYRDDMKPRAVAGSHPLFHIFTPLLLVIHRDWFGAYVTTVRRQRMWLAPVYTDYTGPTGLIGSGEDLARFGEAFLEGGALAGNRILKSETVAEMLDRGYGGNTGPDKDRMGLGWHWWNDAPLPFKGHGGEGPGFGAQLAIFPESNMVIALLTNDTLIDRIGLTNTVAAVFDQAAT
jgi:D-alanyl-D-alanine carboxypeptidase